MNLLHLVDGFRKRFKAEPRVFRAPGRVNLIGEHTDYNDGFVMPAAIHFATYVAVNERDDTSVSVYSHTLREAFEFDLTRPGKFGGWRDYVAGTAYALQERGVKLAGANLYIDSDVPLGAGLSSSAALEVATARALLSVARANVDPLAIALACQRAENEYVGVRSGIMDQFVSCFGLQGHALMIDCRTLDYEALPLPPGVVLVVCNTMVKHELTGGEYNERRADCEEGSRLLGVAALRDVTVEAIHDRGRTLPERVHRRCRHVVTENERVELAADALRKHDCSRFGELMYDSHRSLREDYEVTCEELDLMVNLAREVSGVDGARMTGGGFGGCTINLVADDAVERFQRSVADAYRERTGIKPMLYVTAAHDGAGEIVLAG